MTRVTVTLGRVVIVSATERSRRAHEIAARERDLYRQLADRDAVLESQRRIYMERFRKLEAQIRDREQDVLVLRARLGALRDDQYAIAR